jgi:hypothetical protein
LMKETTVMEVAVKNDWKRRWRILGKRFCGEEVKYDGKVLLLLLCYFMIFFVWKQKGFYFYKALKFHFLGHWNKNIATVIKTVL